VPFQRNDDDNIGTVDWNVITRVIVAVAGQVASAACP